MVKLSFKVQLAVIIATMITVVFVIIHFVGKTNEQTQFAQRMALQSANFGFQTVIQKPVSVSPEGEFVFMIDSLQNISGETEDGGKYSVTVTKDTISTDSIEIKIVSVGTFANETNSQLMRMLFVSPDSVNWVRAD